jgi:hypothetical protein
MTTRETLHLLVDQLPDEQADLACEWLEDLRDASDVGGPPLDAATMASLGRGLADVVDGRVKPLDQYERERGLGPTGSLSPTKPKRSWTALTVRRSDASALASRNSRTILSTLGFRPNSQSAPGSASPALAVGGSCSRWTGMQRRSTSSPLMLEGGSINIDSDLSDWLETPVAVLAGSVAVTLLWVGRIKDEYERPRAKFRPRKAASGAIQLNSC